MSNITLSPNAAGSATFIIASPATSTNRTLTLPDATSTLVGTDASQTLTNKTVLGGTIQQGTAQASTSGTAIDFTGIPSWAKRVTVMYTGLSTTGTSIIQLQLGTSSGAVASGYVGQYQQGTTTAAITTGAGICPFTSAAASNYGSIRIENLTGNNWVMTGINGVSTPSVSLASSYIGLSGTLDRVRITTVNGTDTFDAGSINIMWEG